MIKVQIIEKDLSFKLTGIFFKIQNLRGRFCKEKQYCDDFEKELKNLDLEYIREKDIRVLVPEALVGNRPDFIVLNKIALDFKAKPYITKDDYNQMQRYL